MSFIEWYKDKYKNEWNEDYALSISSLKWIEEYQNYCDYNNIKPVWNG